MGISVRVNFSDLIIKILNDWQTLSYQKSGFHSSVEGNSQYRSFDLAYFSLKTLSPICIANHTISSASWNK